MSDTPVTVDDSAERAYAEAAGAVAATVKPAQVKRSPKAGKPTASAPAAKAAEPKAAEPVPTEPLAVETPAVAKAAPASQAAAAEPADTLADATTAEPLALPGLRPAPAAKAPVKVAAKKPAIAVAKTAAAPAEKPVKAPTAKKVRAKQPAAATPKIFKPVVKATIKPPIAEKPKDTIMTKTTKISDSIKSLASDAQDKAKTVIEKGSALIGETTEFTKGNVAAVVESGKILASGLQQMGSAAVTDTKDVISTIQSDFKELASVKSPTELIEVQNGLIHRNFDRAVAYNSKASETFLKLANDMMAPISGRFSLAMQKVRKAA